ncbi:MAG: DegT/DnrJ/EryC1/StrS aminotransferase family protein [Lachnospiraceae bacterium]|nr:DegT/DnrJ/EryC1/StrS aminotransferase family protein [Lachnospiraceae bacterium]
MELGSNFELDISSLHHEENHIFHYLETYHAYYMDSGRSALAVLNQVLTSGIILLPSYICESVVKVYRENFSIIFYKIERDFTVDTEDLDSKLSEGVTAVYLMHYFGQLQDETFLNWLNKKRRQYEFVIIEDTTHSIFTKRRTIGDYCVCSLRKWFPVPDGGVLYSENERMDISLVDISAKSPSAVLEAMILKKLYIEGKADCNELYRKIFTEEEEKLDKQRGIYRISELSRSLLKYFSIDDLKGKRRKNYRMLRNALQECEIELALKDGQIVPLACPIYLDDRDEFRQYLARHRVYCAVHWPLTGTGLEEHKDAKEMSEQILSLPIDQRYGADHIQYLAEIIRDYVKIRR